MGGGQFHTFCVSAFVDAGRSTDLSSSACWAGAISTHFASAFGGRRGGPLIYRGVHVGWGPVPHMFFVSAFVDAGAFRGFLVGCMFGGCHFHTCCMSAFVDAGAFHGFIVECMFAGEGISTHVASALLWTQGRSTDPYWNACWAGSISMYFA